MTNSESERVQLLFEASVDMFEASSEISKRLDRLLRAVKAEAAKTEDPLTRRNLMLACAVVEKEPS